MTASSTVTKSVAVEVIGRGSIGTTHEPFDGVAVLGDLVEVLLGEEAGVGHQALVHRAELVDAELGVGDEAAVACPFDSLLSSRCRSTRWRASLPRPTSSMSAVASGGRGRRAGR